MKSKLKWKEVKNDSVNVKRFLAKVPKINWEFQIIHHPDSVSECIIWFERDMIDPYTIIEEDMGVEKAKMICEDYLNDFLDKAKKLLEKK